MADENKEKISVDVQKASQDLVDAINKELESERQKKLDEIAAARKELAKTDRKKLAEYNKVYDAAVEILKKKNLIHNLLHEQANSTSNSEEERTKLFAALRVEGLIEELNKAFEQKKEAAKKAREAKDAKKAGQP